MSGSWRLLFAMLGLGLGETSFHSLPSPPGPSSSPGPARVGGQLVRRARQSSLLKKCCLQRQPQAWPAHAEAGGEETVGSSLHHFSPPTSASPERAGVPTFWQCGQGKLWVAVCRWCSSASGVEYLLTHLTHLNGEEQRGERACTGLEATSHTPPPPSLVNIPAKQQFQATSHTKKKTPQSSHHENIGQQMGPFTKQYQWGKLEAGGQFMLKTELWALPSVHQGHSGKPQPGCTCGGPSGSPSGHTLKTTS